MTEADTTSPTCPPHYWLITEDVPASRTQVWTCRRCAIRRDVSAIEVRLTAATGSTTPGADALALDDRAWAIVPPERERNILLVSDGDPYLETALGFLPNAHLFGVKPDRYPADAVRTDGRLRRAKEHGHPPAVDVVVARIKHRGRSGRRRKWHTAHGGAIEIVLLEIRE